MEEVLVGFFTALAVLRSQGTGLIRVTRSKTCFATSPPLPTDAKPRAESSLLELCRGAKEEEPPLGGSKGNLGGMSIFFIFLASVVFGFRNAIEDSTMQIEPRSSLLEKEGSICIVIAGSYPKSAATTSSNTRRWRLRLFCRRPLRG